MLPFVTPTLAAPSEPVTALAPFLSSHVFAPAARYSIEDELILNRLRHRTVITSAPATNGSTTNGRHRLTGRTRVRSTQDGLAPSPPRCVLHVGPHKTGSTTLQQALGRDSTRLMMLSSDGWQYPLTLPGPFAFGDVKNPANLALYLRGFKDADPLVWPTFERWLADRSEAQENVLITSEEFDDSDVNISLLAAALRPFATTVVMSHRPFYSWLPSVHRELCNADITAGPACRTPGVPPLARWLTRGQVLEMVSPSGFFTLAVLQRYARFYGDLFVLPLDDKLLETFVCSPTILYAQRTCSEIRSAPPPLYNVRHGDYLDLNSTCASECVDQGAHACPTRDRDSTPTCVPGMAASRLAHRLTLPRTWKHCHDRRCQPSVKWVYPLNHQARALRQARGRSYSS